MSVELVKMTRELFHELWRGFEYDPAMFLDTALYNSLKDYKYDPEKVEAHYNRRVSDKFSITFAVMLGEEVIGEVVLKRIDPDEKHCELGIHLKNDSVKGKGFGTAAERLAIEYAFNELGMNTVLADSIVRNTRSRHIIEKLGFERTDEKEGFVFYKLERSKYHADSVDR